MKIYDNGTRLLGMVMNLKRYITEKYIVLNIEDLDEEMTDILEELEEYDENSIVCINYDFGMGYLIDEWKESDKLKDNDNIRICDNCHKIMDQGYCIDDGLEYYCSDICLNTKYSEEEFNGMYSQGCAYYTTWED